jgi:hypothetical protein
MERNTQINGLINLFALAAAAIGTFARGRYSGAQSGQVAAAVFGMGLLIAVVSWFQMRLGERERMEKLEFDEVTRGSEAARCSTPRCRGVSIRRSREQFERFFIPGFTILLLACKSGAWFLWRWLGLARAPVTS